MKFSIYRDKRGEYRWRLTASNGKVVADSAEGYKNFSDCRRQVVRIQTAARSAKLELMI